MSVPVRLLSKKDYGGAGYNPVVDFKSWRVAVLNYIDELECDQIKWIQKHNETDEAFILLSGKCILFIFDGSDFPDRLYSESLIPGKIYNVKAGTWHTHTLSEDARVLIVENSDTRLWNSPRIKVDEVYREEFIRITKKFWNGKTR